MHGCVLCWRWNMHGIRIQYIVVARTYVVRKKKNRSFLAFTAGLPPPGPMQAGERQGTHGVCSDLSKRLAS
jgi:hypothetical protein